MTFFSQEWFHDFPDRGHRQLLQNRDNLAEFLTDADAELAGQLDLLRARSLDRELPLPDWRRREIDLFFEVPFRTRPEVGSAAVCVLVEHQSSEDQAMPLRMLLEAVLFWERQWRAWQERRRRGEPLRLSVVWPIVFHTGQEPWATSRRLIDLFAGPQRFLGQVPVWEPGFWDLAARTPQQLLSGPGEWLKAMALVRAEEADRATFVTLLREVFAALEPLGERDTIRWHELLWFLLSYAANRRPAAERQEFFAAAVASQRTVALQHEVRTMSEQVQESWIDWARRHYSEIGRDEGRNEGRDEGRDEGRREGLAVLRETLRALLEQRFGTLPPEFLERLGNITDFSRLQSAVLRAHQVASWAELNL